MGSFQIDPHARIGSVGLQVADLERQAGFYRDVLGFREIQREKSVVSLSARGNFPEQIVLRELPGARARSFSSPGLFHVAFLLPSRKELARTLKRAADRGWRFQGFADHGVSEALYLSDPEGNGIELYRDRPRSEWPIRGTTVEMVTKGLDIQDLLRELKHTDDGRSPTSGIHLETTIGHVHLQVSDLQKSGEFYNRILGFDITQKTYPGALFVSAGGYHHHIGMNIWNSQGAPPGPPDAVGLIFFKIQVSETASLQSIQKSLRNAGIEILEASDKHPLLQLQDPDGVRIDISLAEHANVFS